LRLNLPPLQSFPEIPAKNSHPRPLCAKYQQQINPQGAIEQTLFDELLTAAWNLRCVRILEAEIGMLDPRYDRLARHHTRFERTFHRALNQLRTIQTDAALHHMLPREVRHRTPVLASPLKIAKRSQERDHKYVAMPNKVPNKAEWQAAAAARSTALPFPNQPRR